MKPEDIVVGQVGLKGVETPGPTSSPRARRQCADKQNCSLQGIIAAVRVYIIRLLILID